MLPNVASYVLKYDDKKGIGSLYSSCLGAGRCIGLFSQPSGFVPFGIDWRSVRVTTFSQFSFSSLPFLIIPCDLEEVILAYIFAV